jgi:hypothetical protein
MISRMTVVQPTAAANPIHVSDAVDRVRTIGRF